MENPTANPLSKHFRQPAIYLKLPSQGKFYPNGSIELSATGDIPVYPMTVKDELTLKTPDALMNGEGMANVIHSCCPAIKDPWVIPAVDLDAIFIAVRLASYGSGMDINTTCPHCKADNESTINLTMLLDNIKPVTNYNYPVTVDNLQFKFKPQSYRDVNKLNIATFEEQRLIQNIVGSDLADEEKKRLFDESFEKITRLNVEMLIASIDSITVEGATVNNTAQIKEFLDNCSRQTYTAIKSSIEKLSTFNRIEPLDLTCGECEKTYQSGLVFDQANFFE